MNQELRDSLYRKLAKAAADNISVGTITVDALIIAITEFDKHVNSMSMPQYAKDAILQITGALSTLTFFGEPRLTGRTSDKIFDWIKEQERQAFETVKKRT